MKPVISVSRRTDIPAFYSDLFIKSLDKGFIEVTHPYTKEKNKVSLKPEDVGAFVFWSKNFDLLIKKLDRIEAVSKNLFFHFTITGAKELEPLVPDPYDAIKDLIYLSQRYSPEHIIWRYDPICITDKLPFELFEERFIKYAESLKGYVKTCYISFAHPYRKVINTFNKNTNHVLMEVPDGKKIKFTEQLAVAAAGYGINISACCNNYLLSEKVGKASCINGRFLSNLFKTPLSEAKASTRQECVCTKSIDIGDYKTCKHGCLYCYAS